MRISGLRWLITGALVTGAVINYVDRSALGVAAKHIRQDLNLSATQYASVASAFLIAYTLSYFLGGMVTDRIGTRRSVAGTLTWWSLANMAHGLAHDLPTLIVCRFLLGLGEAMFYTAALRCVAEWFQARDRSKPVGLVLGGSSLGALLAPLIVAPMMAHSEIGWRGAFIVTGALGFLLLPFWLWVYHPPARHPRLTEAERGYLSEDREEVEREHVPLGLVLRMPQAWVLMFARALTDASWYVIVFWLHQYLQKDRGFTDVMIAQYGWIPFASADLGAIFGGWFSSRLIAGGMPLLAARKFAMFCCALLMIANLPAYFIPAGMPMVALGLLSLATFGHMAWGTNSWTLHGDLFPASRVATVLGITGAAGSLGGVAVQWGVGTACDLVGSFLPVFIVTATLHPIAALVLMFTLKQKSVPASTA